MSEAYFDAVTALDELVGASSTIMSGSWLSEREVAFRHRNLRRKLAVALALLKSEAFDDGSGSCDQRRLLLRRQAKEFWRRKAARKNAGPIDALLRDALGRTKPAPTPAPGEDASCSLSEKHLDIVVALEDLVTAAFAFAFANRDNGRDLAIRCRAFFQAFAVAAALLRQGPYIDDLVIDIGDRDYDQRSLHLAHQAREFWRERARRSADPCHMALRGALERAKPALRLVGGGAA